MCLKISFFVESLSTGGIETNERAGSFLYFIFRILNSYMCPLMNKKSLPDRVGFITSMGLAFEDPACQVRLHVVSQMLLRRVQFVAGLALEFPHF